MAVHLTQRRFTVDEYEQMVEVGILGPDDHVELIEGAIVEMPPIGPLHADVVRWLSIFFVRTLEDRAVVSVQSPVRLPTSSEPQPDIALLRPGSYRQRHPEPADILLVVEVADTTVLSDRRYKIPMYARSRVAEAWLVDLTMNVLEVYRGPRTDGYSEQVVVRPGDAVHPQAFSDVAVQISEMLGQ